MGHEFDFINQEWADTYCLIYKYKYRAFSRNYIRFNRISFFILIRYPLCLIRKQATGLLAAIFPLPNPTI
jgi:hypothetical protein